MGVACLLAALEAGGAAASGEAVLTETVRPFVRQYCVACHGAEDPEADFRIDTLGISRGPEEAESWQLVLDNLHLGEMPPPDEPQPEGEEVEPVARWIEGELERARKAFAGHTGEVVFRRLNRTEYRNTIEDLFGIREDLTSGFPEDALEDGFDNNGAALMLSSQQVDQYLTVADRVLGQVFEALRPPRKQRVTKTLREIQAEREAERLERERRKGSNYTPTEAEKRRKEEARRSGNFGPPYFPDYGEDALIPTRKLSLASTHLLHVQEPGRYRFTFTAYPVRQEKEVLELEVVKGAYNGRDFLPELLDEIQLTSPEPQEFSFEADLLPREVFRLTFLNGTPFLSGSKIAEHDYPAVAIRSVTMEGPLVEAWPPPGYQLVFGTRTPEAIEALPAREIPGIVHAVAPKLFRRPVPDHVLEPFVAFAAELTAAGEAPLEALRQTLRGMLCSPWFLYHVEPAEGPDGFALASRLSYFLWRSMPDAALLELAASGRLHEPEVLAGQVERLLQDPKSDRFVRDFTERWLQVDRVGEMQPDRTLYREYDVALERAMKQETLLFVEELIREDLSLSNLLDSDWTMLNDRLAEHYGIEGVEGDDFRKVLLPAESVRGGILTHASLLTLTSNGTVTSPVVRGVYLLEHLLGNPAPPPPPDVPAIEPDIRGATTIREQLAKHREIPQCAACHQKIDPFGFALENFDVIGGWRENYRVLRDVEGPQRPQRVEGPPVDASDQLPNGAAFSGFEEFRDLLKQDEALVYENMAHKLTAYALGRSLDFADRDHLARIVRETRASGGGFRSMIHAVVRNPVFQNP